NFPRRPEPTDENLADLKKAVISMDADLGIAHDGDADRTAVVDENGEHVEPDRLLALFARHESASRVVAPLNTSMVVDEVVEVERTKVGDVYVAQRLKETGAAFGGEPSNSWIFPDSSYCPDGVLAAAKVCEMVDETKNIGELAGELPSYEVRRGSIECSNDRKQEVMRRVFESVSQEYDDYSDLDGVRVDTGDGWFLIRPSGTEPLIRITSEASDAETAERLFTEAREILEDSL
ncbi:MAG: phosphoglucosamine mutase, partial [Halobacteria archaeon]|nr:phosphoglucosamine mutase [Halobacteria archaeon]